MINFIYNWGGIKDVEKRSLCWSGTPLSILDALKNQTNVVDWSITPYTSNIFKKLMIKAIYGNDFNILEVKNGERKINSMAIESGNPCLVFGEYTSKLIKDTYCYQDCTVDLIVRLSKEKNNIAQYSPLPKNANEFAITKHVEQARIFNSNCKGIFTMSKWLAEDLIKNTGLPKEKVHPVGGGCNIDLDLIDHSKKEGRRFLFVGKVWDRKNGPLVVSAFKKLEEKYHDIELYIAGPVNEPDEIHNSDRIKYLGRLSYSELVYYYNLCDFYVMPSRFEAYGLVFAEALIYGLPCIGKNCFAMPEFISDGENGYLIDEDSTEQLSEKMELLLINKDIAKNVMSDMEHYKELYSWDAVAKRMITVMKADGYEL